MVISWLLVKRGYVADGNHFLIAFDGEETNMSTIPLTK